MPENRQPHDDQLRRRLHAAFSTAAGAVEFRTHRRYSRCRPSPPLRSDAAEASMLSATDTPLDVFARCAGAVVDRADGAGRAAARAAVVRAGIEGACWGGS